MERSIPTRVGLIGWPVGHSRSPAMHNQAFAHLGLNWQYLLLPVRPEDVADAVRGLRALGFAGANVTVPHKLAVMQALDEVMPEAQAIGAVNTIVNRDGHLVGYNTDGIGFLRALREGGFSLAKDDQPKNGGRISEYPPSAFLDGHRNPQSTIRNPQSLNCRALLLGAGGASRAVLYALLSEGTKVTIVNRTLSRAERLAQEFGELFAVKIPVMTFDCPIILQEALNQANLLVNATSVGMQPHIETSPLPADIRFPPSLTVYDLVYNPLETRLLADARAAGASAIDGLGMLIHQGAVAFSLWTGEEAPVDVMRAAAMA